MTGADTEAADRHASATARSERSGDGLPAALTRSLGPAGHGWFAVALVAGVVVSATYLFTHPYPAYGAGLYLDIAEQIRSNGFRLPARVPHYAEGLPLAYPPLQFYVVAVLLELGVSGLAVSRVVPAVVTVLVLVPFYGVGLELLATRRQAGVAATILAVAPPTLQWHLSAGGIVRGSAFLLTLCGIYAGCRLFGRGTRRWAVAGTVLFTLTLLSHPVYTVYFGLSWLVLYAGLDRSLRGLVEGAVVAAGGVLLAAPWWLTVASRHGVGVFTGAAGSHSGLAGGVGRLLDQFVYPLDPTVVSLFFLGVFAATLVAVARGRYLLPAWLVVGAYVVGKERFQFVPGALLLGSVLCGVAVPRAARWWPALDRRPRLDRQQVAVATLAVVLLVAGGVGTLYAASALPAAHHGSASLPAFVDDDDREAMDWVATHTAADESFVVLGDAAEWFPYYAERPLLVGPWGVEWESPDQYYTQIERFERASECADAACLDGVLAADDNPPDYVYVPRGHYTVRGLEHEGTAALRHTMVASSRYERVYRNEGVVVFRVTPRTSRSTATTVLTRRRAVGPR
ncbi:hypothetical protein [Salinirubrum litoreum]|uniref:Dolichyl-phosphate-mannose-protein mannosyltransferase n=1 Tax=Salinirubrum litoreum TaxID=1126234 RepID=A0ABD5RC88_9EURY|nr:hypothetical protein [Salinirubrum litoreum]